MSHHRSYEETYQELGRAAKEDIEEKITTNYEAPMNPKFGDHIKERKTLDRSTEGNGDQLDRHQVLGSFDKKDKALVHDVLLGDEKPMGGMDYIQ